MSLAADDPRHGSANAYTNLGCRCRACCDAHTAYLRDRGMGPYKRDRCPDCGWPKLAAAARCRECDNLAREAPHGSEARYRRCRCDACRAAAASARRARRQRPNVRVHNANGYANGCRCETCRAANTRRAAERRAALAG